MSSASTRVSRLPSLDEDEQPTTVERSYLEVIFYLASRREPVIAAQLVRWMGVRPPTVTHTLQRLLRKGLIAREDSGEIQLTDSGQAQAEQVVRRHRLIERFLYDVMGIPWHQLHREAVRLEPAISPIFEKRIEALIGDAKTCPHGNPIPGRSEQPSDDVRLSDAPVGAWFVITRIDEEAGEDSCTLQLLWTRGLLPGTSLARLPDPLGGVAIRRADRRTVLSPRVAGLIWGTYTASIVHDLRPSAKAS